jgi:hypothetical protein
MWIDLPRIVMARAKFLIGSRPGEMTWYFRSELFDPTPTTMSVLALQLDLWWQDWYSQTATTETQFDRIEMRDMTTRHSSWFNYRVSLMRFGSWESDTLPQNACPILQYQTGSRRHERQGHTHLIGTPVDFWQGTLWDVLYQQQQRSYFAQLRSYAASTTHTQVVVSRIHNSTVRATPLISVVTDAVMQDAVGSARRRLGIGKA